VQLIQMRQGHRNHQQSTQTVAMVQLMTHITGPAAARILAVVIIVAAAVVAAWSPQPGPE
jgi:type IV secretory pathway VirB2 component (pilin)